MQSIEMLYTFLHRAHTPGEYHMLNIENEFRQPLSIDDAPQGSVCEWCGKPAKHQLTALGGKNHNQSGLFCSTCGEAFVCAVASSLQREVPAKAVING